MDELLLSPIPDPNPIVDHISLPDKLTFCLALAFQLPIIVASCLIRRLGTNNGISLRADLVRSVFRTMHVPNSVMQTLLKTNQPNAVLTSNRFQNASHCLCDHILRTDFAGYWICKGPPNQPETPTKLDKILIHVHGGGYVAGHPLGSVAQFLRVAELAGEQNLTLGIFALQYSLGPQATFPRQVEEAVAAYRYLVDELQIDPCNIIMEGDSAGGHLVLSLLQDIYEQGLPRPGGCILIYPWVNLTNSGASFQRNQFKDVLTKDGLDHAADQVLGPDGRFKFSHLCNFSKPRPKDKLWTRILPRTWVSTGTDDCFVDDIVAFVENARSDGADVAIQLVDGKSHAWITLDDCRHIRAYCQLDPSAKVENMMLGAQHIFEGLSAVLS